MKQKIIVTTAILTVVLAGGGFLYFKRSQHSPQATAVEQSPAVPVIAAAVTSKNVPIYLRGIGTVIAYNTDIVRSQIQGQLTQITFTEGQTVKAGDLLAQIDPLTVRNQYNQLLAAYQAAQANVSITAAQKKRADELFSREAMTAVDHENAQLGAANALASLARAQADLQIAKQALNDATVRAPSAGTIIEQDATKGMVIASATSSASGGTILFKMADLNRIQMQALVGETDVGNLTPGMSARVTVDAFPNRQFPGQVIKVEPQAVVQQSVTMFPVLVAIQNDNGRLLPGMNGQVTIDIASRTQVVAVPLKDVLDLLDDLRVEGAGHRGHEQADRHRGGRQERRRQERRREKEGRAEKRN